MSKFNSCERDYSSIDEFLEALSEATARIVNLGVVALCPLLEQQVVSAECPAVSEEGVVLNVR